MTRFLMKFVKAGELITIGPWNAMVRAVRACQLIAGRNVRLRWLPAGTIINFDGVFTAWNHPFKVTLEGNGVRLREGLVSTVPCHIKGVYLNGKERLANGKEGKDVGIPTLTWDEKPEVNAEGKGWIAVEITCDETWKVKSAEIVQVANLSSDDSQTAQGVRGGPPTLGGVASLPGRRGRHPVGLVRLREDGSVSLFQVTHHNLQHRARFDSPNKDEARHFFWPA